jgi:hypothetical protein
MFPSFERFRRTAGLKYTFYMSALVAIILGSSTAVLGGQGKYTLGMTADLTGGGAGPTYPGITGAQNPNTFAPFVGSYPSITFKARGEHAELDSYYGFGYEKYFTDPSYEDHTHSASLAFSTPLGPKWSFSLADNFSNTSNSSSYRLLSGTTVDPEQFQFAFTPVFARSNQSNTASIALSRAFSKRSSMSINGSYSTLNYPGGPLTNRVLTDQKRIAGTVSYIRTGEHYSWTIGYSGVRFNFAGFQDSFDHSAIVGYTYMFSPKTSIQLSAGPSYLQSLENIKSPMGVNTTVALNRMVQKGTFTLSFNQTGGGTSGLGSVSRYREAVLSMTHNLGQSMRVSANVSGFNTTGLQVNPVSARGISAGGNLEFPLDRYWSLNFGGQYQHYEGYNTAGYDQKRIFASLRYGNPEIWRLQQ